MRSGNRRSNYHCSLATTTGYFATRNAAGITGIYCARPDKDHKIAAYGELNFWSCNGATDPRKAGHVTALFCPGNQLTALSVLGLTYLEHLDCSFNDLVSLDLWGLTALETVILTKNRLATLDVRALARLKTLDCYGNLLTALDLTGRDRLEVLECSMNQLVSLKLGGCKSLHTIYAYRNQIGALGLSDLPALRHSDLGGSRSTRESLDSTNPADPSPNLECHDGPLLLIHPSHAPDLAETTTHALYAAKYVSPCAHPLTLEEADVRATAYALKEPTPEALATAAPAMAALIRGPCWLVPIPASDGGLTANLILARGIAALVPGAHVKIAIGRTQPVESSTARRRRGEFGLTPEEHHIIRTADLMEPLPVYFVDNVITTGNTLRAARAALGWGTGLAYADASTRRNTVPFQAEFITQLIHHETPTQVQHLQ